MWKILIFFLLRGMFEIDWNEINKINDDVEENYVAISGLLNIGTHNIIDTFLLNTIFLQGLKS
jgi:hypothetical protein